MVRIIELSMLFSSDGKKVSVAVPNIVGLAERVDTDGTDIYVDGISSPIAVAEDRDAILALMRGEEKK